MAACRSTRGRVMREQLPHRFTSRLDVRSSALSKCLSRRRVGFLRRPAVAGVAAAAGNVASGRQRHEEQEKKASCSVPSLECCPCSCPCFGSFFCGAGTRLVLVQDASCLRALGIGSLTAAVFRHHHSVAALLYLRPLREAMANARKACMLFAALAAMMGLRQSAFVPGPRGVAPMAAAGGVLAMAGAAPAHADKIDDAAKKLSEASYPFLKEIDWSSDVYGKLPTANPFQVLKAVDKTPSRASAPFIRSRSVPPARCSPLCCSVPPSRCLHFPLEMHLSLSSRRESMLSLRWYPPGTGRGQDDCHGCGDGLRGSQGGC